ncbi:putative 37S ribosomal protein S5, mitochondrial [Psilocybe cubensis]|uniref:S5 DRBM domain-containing protein n=2 Tax=Psilocybe cubensis TaxID=181762 RepID=A0A8H7XWY5_PSICU|nr:putative 37S ribosomal protein S5, mitochondrial [Psilocybe cubensis]KAH9478745.1 putative 37S ribosomal protein S5, mitochondrial [Psilocybe cubensis]
MNRLLLLRPISRAAARTNGAVAPARRDLARAFSTTSCQNIRATPPANKRKKGMTEVDAEFFGGPFEAAPGQSKQQQHSKQQPKQQQPKSEAKPQQLRPSVVHSARPSKQTTDFKSKEVVQAEQVESTSALPPQLDEQLFADLLSNEPINIEEYYASWFSLETRQALEQLRIDRYAFVCSILETDLCSSLINAFDPQTEEEFEKRFLAFEISEKNDDTPLLPLLEFFLRGGLQLLPPKLNAMRPEECIQLVKQSVVEEAFNTQQKGPWQLKSETVQNYISSPVEYPDLMTPDSILDPREVYDFPASKETPFQNQVIVRNHRSVFHEYNEGEEELLGEEESGPPIEEDEGGDSVINALPVSASYYQNLYHSILMRRPVVQQTGKGKIRRVAYMVLVGDGKGLVGYGEGKHSNAAVALKAARIAAVKNMDWVERFEQRTIWTEMRTKLGATQLILRPRPVGFGLRCNPFLHQILRAAGLKDISAKVWGSRNKLNVIKAAFRMLHAGHAPTGMGDGVGGKGKKLSKGSGVRGKAEIERARGRKLISLRH